MARSRSALGFRALAPGVGLLRIGQLGSIDRFKLAQHLAGVLGLGHRVQGASQRAQKPRAHNQPRRATLDQARSQCLPKLWDKLCALFGQDTERMKALRATLVEPTQALAHAAEGLAKLAQDGAVAEAELVQQHGRPTLNQLLNKGMAQWQAEPFAPFVYQAEKQKPLPLNPAQALAVAAERVAIPDAALARP